MNKPPVPPKVRGIKNRNFYAFHNQKVIQGMHLFCSAYRSSAPFFAADQRDQIFKAFKLMKEDIPLVRAIDDVMKDIEKIEKECAKKVPDYDYEKQRQCYNTESAFDLFPLQDDPFNCEPVDQIGFLKLYKQWTG